MKKHVLTVLFVLGLSAAVAFAQSGAGAAQSGSGGNYPPGAAAGTTNPNNPDQMGQQPPMSEQRPDASERHKDKNKDKSSSMANVDDESLHRQVHEQLASNPDLQNVQITVKDGVVTLDGTVPKKEDKKEAKKLAKSIPGVKGVKEHLTVNASASAAAPSSMGGVSGQTAGAATGTENQPSSQPSTGAVAGQTGATSSTTGQTSATTGTTTGSATGEMGQTGAATSSTGMGQTSAGSTAAMTASPCSSLSSQAGVSGGASGQTGSTAGATSGDLASQIQSEICKDPTLASNNITVSQQGNQIILSGTVPSTDVKDKAADIAMRFANGMSLVNNLQVSGQAGTPPSTAGGISGAVGGTANPSAPSSGAQAPSVSGQAGVGAQTPESGVGATAGASTGARSGTAMSTGDDQLRTQIETALRQEPTLSNDNINVNLTSDQVELSGTVANGKDRQTAKRIAESFAGNRKVVDHLTVSGEGKSNVPPDKN